MAASTQSIDTPIDVTFNFSSSNASNSSTAAFNSNSNATNHPGFVYPKFINNYWAAYATSYALWFIFVTGVIGNLFIFGVLIWRRNKSQIVTQLFIGSMAVADFGLLISDTWAAALQAVNPSWNFSVLACKMCQIWSPLTAHASIWTLMVIAIDR